MTTARRAPMAGRSYIISHDPKRAEKFVVVRVDRAEIKRYGSRRQAIKVVRRLEEMERKHRNAQHYLMATAVRRSDLVAVDGGVDQHPLAGMVAERE